MVPRAHSRRVLGLVLGVPDAARRTRRGGRRGLRHQGHVDCDRTFSRGSSTPRRRARSPDFGAAPRARGWRARRRGSRRARSPWATSASPERWMGREAVRIREKCVSGARGTWFRAPATRPAGTGPRAGTRAMDRDRSGGCAALGRGARGSVGGKGSLRGGRGLRLEVGRERGGVAERGKGLHKSCGKRGSSRGGRVPWLGVMARATR